MLITYLCHHFQFRNCKFEIYPDLDEKLREIITDKLGFKISRHRPLTVEKENAKQQDIQKLIITLNDQFKRKEREDCSPGHQEDDNQISEPTSSSEGIVTSDPGTSNLRTLSAESTTFLNGSHGKKSQFCIYVHDSGSCKTDSSAVSQPESYRS